MALSSSTVWEVRTGGSDTNGGGFWAGGGGTDYSQQDAAQLSVTDAACTGNSTVTSATGGFTTAMVGNNIYLSGGGGGWYQIQSRTDTNTITIDRNGPNATGMTARVGGAMASIGAIGGIMTGLGTPSTIFVKYNASAFLMDMTVQNVAGGRFEFSGMKVAIVGYDTTRTVANDDANRPTIRANTSATATMISCGWAGPPRESFIRNLILDGNSQSGVSGLTIGIDQSYSDRIKAINCPATGIIAGGDITLRGEAYNCGKGFTCSGHFCVSAFNTGSGFETSSCTLENCIAYDNGGWGFWSLGHVNRLFSCVAYENGNTGMGEVYDSRLGQFHFQCVSYGNTGYGYAGFGSGQNGIMVRCAHGNNSSGSGAGAATLTYSGSPFGLLELTAAPFDTAAIAALSSSSTLEDFFAAFRPNTTAGGGAVLRAAGFPAYLDVGAVQHQEAGGGGGLKLVGSGGLAG